MGIEDLNLDLSEHADRILVISENEATRQEIAKLLEKRSYQSIAESSIESAKASTSSELVDMVILENTSVEVEISALLSNLRTDPRLSRCPVIAFGANAEKYDNEKGRKLGR